HRARACPVRRGARSLALSRNRRFARPTGRPRKRPRGVNEMPELKTGPITIDVNAQTRISALLLVPPRPSACFVFAHGAGAGMAHPFMAAAAAGLAERGIASLRYQFPYMERGGKRPDPPHVAHAAVRAAV